MRSLAGQRTRLARGCQEEVGSLQHQAEAVVTRSQLTLVASCDLEVGHCKAGLDVGPDLVEAHTSVEEERRPVEVGRIALEVGPGLAEVRTWVGLELGREEAGIDQVVEDIDPVAGLGLVEVRIVPDLARVYQTVAADTDPEVLLVDQVVVDIVLEAALDPAEVHTGLDLVAHTLVVEEGILVELDLEEGMAEVAGVGQAAVA